MFRVLANKIRSVFMGGQSDLETAIAEGGAVAVERGLERAFQTGVGNFAMRVTGDTEPDVAIARLNLTLSQLRRQPKADLIDLCERHEVEIADGATKPEIVEALAPLLAE